MTPLDLVIIIVYLFGIMAVGILAGYRKNASTEQFFLAGKTLRWPMVGAVLFTANISTIHLVGLSSAGFDVGVVVGNFEWMACFCLLLLGLLFVFFCLKSGITMLPEFLEMRQSRFSFASASVVRDTFPRMPMRKSLGFKTSRQVTISRRLSR